MNNKNKFSLLLLAFFLVFAWEGNAQITNSVGVGTRNPDQSAALDLHSSDKGLLLPRVALTGRSDQTTIASPAKGLMVYNTATAGSGQNQVVANNIYIWNGTLWMKYSSLPEIRLLKQPIHFVLSSKSSQLLTASNLSNFNGTAGVPIRWATGDVLVDNPNDVELLSGGENIRIKTTAFYEVAGSVNFKSNATAATSVLVIMQRSTNNGATWTNVVASVLPYENGTYDKSQTLVFPVVTHEYQANTLIRFIVRKKDGANQQANAGIVYDPTLATDVAKNFRITRLRQEN